LNSGQLKKCRHGDAKNGFRGSSENKEIVSKMEKASHNEILFCEATDQQRMSKGVKTYYQT